RGLAGTGVSSPGSRVAGADRGESPVVAVRSGGLVPGAGGAALRVRLSHRDFRAGGKAEVGVLRPAVPSRRSPGGARRFEGGPPRPPPARAGGVPRTQGQGPNGSGCPRGRVTDALRLVGAGLGGRRTSRQLGPGPRRCRPRLIPTLLEPVPTGV